MARFMYVYHGGSMPETEEARNASMAAWKRWMEEHGPQLVDPGNPVGQSRTVTSGGVLGNGGANPTSGYTIVEAENLDAACEIARDNPILADGGSVEVAEIIQLEM